MILLNPKKHGRFYPAERSREIMLKTIEFFENKGKRQLKADEPQKDMVDKAKDAVVDKALSVGEKLASWLPGSLKKKGEEKVAAIKGKVRQLPADREERIIEWLRKVRTARRNKPILSNAGAEEIMIPKPNGDKAFEVVGMSRLSRASSTAW